MAVVADVGYSYAHCHLLYRLLLSFDQQSLSLFCLHTRGVCNVTVLIQLDVSVVQRVEKIMLYCNCDYSACYS